MSGKNRAFALAVATAALVGMSAPVASAATSQGGPNTSGFNNDSVVNVSGNQVPTQLCTVGVATNTATEVQTLTGILANIAPSVTSGAVSPSQGNNCTNGATETNTVTANTAPSPAASTTSSAGPDSWNWSEGSDHSSDPSSDPTTSGFNNDSVLNVSGNQVATQACTVAGALNTATETQALAGVVNLVPMLTTGAVSPSQGNACTNGTTETNTTTANTGG